MVQIDAGKKFALCSSEPEHFSPFCGDDNFVGGVWTRCSWCGQLDVPRCSVNVARRMLTFVHRDPSPWNAYWWGVEQEVSGLFTSL
jgi:hypothetical protein